MPSPQDDTREVSPPDAHGAPPLAPVASDVASLSFDRLPNDVVDTVEHAFLDTIGVALAGATTSAGRIATRFVRSGSQGGPSTLLGATEGATPSAAAFANGTAAHCLDFDDMSDAISGHPSASLVPAILAVAEQSGASGQDAIVAYVAGFETAATLAGPVLPDHYSRGWHATSTMGTFGAAAAVAHLLGANAERIRTALNTAASMPAGTKRNFGSMVKPMHAGQAARAGVTAATLATEGFDAAEDAVTGDGGFFDLYAPGQELPPSEISLPDELAVQTDGIDRKIYPCCYFTHVPIAAAVSLATEHDLSAEDIDTVKLTASPGAGDALTYEDPQSPAEARFSVEYTVAHALVHRSIGLETFDESRITDPTVEMVRRVVTFDVDTTLEYGSYRSILEIETVDGMMLRKERTAPPGSQSDPLSEAELQEKFDSCATFARGDHDPSTFYDWLRTLSDRTDFSEFGQLVRS